MDRKAAKELLHVQGWLERVDEIVERGRDAYRGRDGVRGSRSGVLGILHGHPDAPPCRLRPECVARVVPSPASPYSVPVTR